MEPISKGMSRAVRWLGLACLVLLCVIPLRSQEPAEPSNWPNEHANTCVAFSPDGKTLATGNVDSAVRLWDVASGRLNCTLRGHGSAITCLVFSPDGKTLASSGTDKKVNFWDLTCRKCTGTKKVDRVAERVAFDGHGRLMAAVSAGQEIHLWDVVRGERSLVTLVPPNQPDGDLFAFMDRYYYVIAFSPDCKILASGGSKNTIRLWQVETGKFMTTLTGHSDDVTSLSFSADGRTLASGSADRTIKLWEVATWGERFTFKNAVSDKVLWRSISSENGREVVTNHTGSVHSVAFSPDGRLLASASTDDEVTLWDVSQGRSLRTLPGHNGGAWCLTFSTNGKLLASGGRDCRLWDVTTGQNRATFLWNADHGSDTFDPKGPVLALAFSPDGQTLVAGSSDGLIHAQNMADPKKTRILRGHIGPITSLSFSADGTTLVSGSMDMTVRVWDPLTCKNTRTMNGLTMLAQLSPDGSTLATVEFAGEGLSSDVKLWHTTNLKLKATLAEAGGGEEAYPIAFSPNGKTLAVHNSHSQVTLWDVATRVKSVCFAAPSCEGPDGKYVYLNPVFSPDGRTLACGTKDGMVELCDVTSGKQTAVVGDRVTTVVAFGPDGTTLATALADKTIALWDLASKKKLTTFKGHKEAIASLCFRPNGKLLASGGFDGVVKLWDTSAFIKPNK